MPCEARASAIKIAFFPTTAAGTRPRRLMAATSLYFLSPLLFLASGVERNSCLLSLPVVATLIVDLQGPRWPQAPVPMPVQGRCLELRRSHFVAITFFPRRPPVVECNFFIIPTSSDPNPQRGPSQAAAGSMVAATSWQMFLCPRCWLFLASGVERSSSLQPFFSV